MPMLNGTLEVGYGLELDLSVLSDRAVNELVVRAIKHVFKNEVSSKPSAINRKRKEAGEALLTTAEEDAMKAEAAAGYFAAMNNDTWGTAGARAPRAISANREDIVFDADVRRAVKASVAGLVKTGKITAIEGRKDAWRTANGEITMDDFVSRYLNHPQLGEGRVAQHREAARVQVEAEKRLAELKKAASPVPTASDDDLMI